MTDAFLQEEQLIVVDRTPLDTCSECPRKERFIATGKVLSTSLPMESGSAVHHAIGSMVGEYVESQGSMNVTELVEYGLAILSASRPDVQPDAIKGARTSLWGIARHLTGLHFLNILRWDGGRDEHCSQLSWDWEAFGLRITSELDFLHSGPSPSVIHEIDWKSGHEFWTSSKVADAFQFNLHAGLILNTYPDVEAVEIRIWNTRLNSLTFPVLFRRDKLHQISHRVRSTAAEYAKWHDTAPEQTEAWPLVEKCESCPAAFLCDCSGMPQTTPYEIVDKLAGVQAQANALEKLAAKYVLDSGEDILTPSGNAFGIGKPKKPRKPTMKLYGTAASDDAESTEES